MIINVNIRKDLRLTDTFEVDLADIKTNLNTDALIARAMEIKVQGIYRNAEDKKANSGKLAAEAWLTANKLAYNFSNDIALAEPKTIANGTIALINAKAKELGMSTADLIAKLTALKAEAE